MADRIVKVILRGDVAGFRGQMAAASKSVADTADKMTAAGREGEKYRQRLSAVGRTAGGVGLAAAAGVGLIVAATANFEQSMSRVEAATHASVATMDALRNAAIEAGRDTVFSATESADAITAMSKAGVEAKDILGGGLAGALALASAGELDVATAADIAATAMNQFNLAGADIPHIADLLAAAAGKAQGEVTDMANSLKYVGPVAAQMGISIEETAGTIAELASQGILGEQAGTSLRGMLTSLTSPSMLAAKQMKALGIELYDATGNFIGLRGVAGQLHETMGNLTNAERDQALGRIFGNEQITAARILYAGGAEDVDKWTAAVNDQNYAVDTARIKLDNLKGDLEQLKGSLETAFIGSGSGSQDQLRGLTQGATDAVNAFNDLPPALQSSTTGLLAITAITGGALWFGSKVIKSVSSTRTALNDLGADATKVGRTIRTALVAGAIIEGLDLIEGALDGIFDHELDGSKLGRSLTALAQGNVTGEFLDKYGTNLEGFADDVSLATDKLGGLSRAAGKVPLVGDFLSSPPWTKSPKDAAKNIAQIDEALANLVESGDSDAAASIFDQLTAAAERNGIGAEKVAGQLGQYQVALDNAADAGLANSGAALLVSDALNGLLPSTDGMTAATGALGTAAQRSAENLEAQAEALKKSREAASGTAHEFFGIGESVDDAKVSLGDWIKTLEDQAKALEDFTKNAKEAAENGLRKGLIAELEAAGPAGAMRLAQLADASDAEIDRANRAWKRGQRAIERYVNVVGGVPKLVIDVETREAERRLRILRRHLAELKAAGLDSQITANQSNFADIHSANGGTIPHAAAGWTVAGQRQPYGDKVLAYLAPGEEVITNRNGEADRFRSDRAAGRIPAYAAGGSAMAQPAMVSVGPSIDYDRLAAAMSAVRPLYGDVKISGDPTTFRRQMEQDRRHASLDGRRRP